MWQNIQVGKLSQFFTQPRIFYDEKLTSHRQSLLRDAATTNGPFLFQPQKFSHSKALPYTVHITYVLVQIVYYGQA